MIRFESLEAAGLSTDFDETIHGEQPVVDVKEKDDTIELSYFFPGFTVADDDMEIDGKSMPFREVGISHAGFVSESGRPLLPSFGRFVQIPADCGYEVEVRKSKPVEFDDILVTPAQEEAIDGEKDETTLEFDEDAYSRDMLYPEQVVEITGPQVMDDYRVLLVHVRPLQYNAAKKRLVGYGNISVEIKLCPKEDVDEEQFDEYMFADPPTNREGFGNLLLNPRRRILERLELRRRGRVVMPTRARGPEFLIIHDPGLRTPAERLAKWKIMRGLRTEVVSIATVGNTTTQIKEYIRQRRRLLFSRLRYVLLFGDVESIVTEQLPGVTTDHYFFTQRDPAGPSDCLLPWVSGGRIPVQTETEGLDVVDQIIKYEKRPPADSEYYRRMTFAGYFQDNSPQDGKADRAYIKTMEGIRDHMVGLGFDVNRAYVSNNPNPLLFKDGTAVPADVRAAIVDSATATDILINEATDGQLLIGHRDHAGPTGWAHPPLHSGDLPSIAGPFTSIFYSINCQSGRFDRDPQDCFAEAILKLDGGTPSLIAATENSGTWRNDSMMKALFDAMWPGVIPTFPGTTASYPIKFNRLGDLLNYARSYLLVAHGSTSGVKHHFEIYHVIGDPTVQLWAHEPYSMRLRTKLLRDRLDIRMSACPSGSVLTVWYQGRLLKRMEPSSAHLTLRLRDLLLTGARPALPLWRRNLHVCFAAPGYRFAQAGLRFTGIWPPLRPEILRPDVRRPALPAPKDRRRREKEEFAQH